MRRYVYVGPEAIRAAAVGLPAGTPITSLGDLARWLANHASDREGATTPATYTVAIDGSLRIAHRRSEHVACAAGEPVLAAGELFLAPDGVKEASNLSTGYCPEPACFEALAHALDRAAIPRPATFTHAFDFRRCPGCGERNLIKDADFSCALCDAALPAAWNL